MSRLNHVAGLIVVLVMVEEAARLGGWGMKACPANVQSTSKRQVQFDGVTSPGLLAVYADFRKNPELTLEQRNIECYDIEILAGTKYHTISQIPKSPERDDVFLVGGDAPWAKGVIYKVEAVTEKIIERHNML